MIMSGKENACSGLKASLLSRRLFHLKSFTCVWNRQKKTESVATVVKLDGLRRLIHYNDDYWLHGRNFTINELQMPQFREYDS